MTWQAEEKNNFYDVLNIANSLRKGDSDDDDDNKSMT